MTADLAPELPICGHESSAARRHSLRLQTSVASGCAVLEFALRNRFAVLGLLRAREPSACSRRLVDPCARLGLCLDTCTRGLRQRPEDRGMFSLSTLLQRRPDEQSGRSRTDPHARRTTAQWACDVVHDRAYAMLGRITRHRQRGATTPRWASCCKEKACLDLRKICTVGSENGAGNVAARRHTAHGPQLSFC